MAAAESPVVESESAHRHRLGIPADAERVLVFIETSHWDPDWLLTSEGYYRLRVRRNLLQAIDQLLADPHRVYSVECLFFLRMFFERVPHRRNDIRELVNQGRLRLMGSGVTTPDTIVPPTEMLIRDYLLGQEWLRDNGMTPEPAVAYFPDTFGFSPGLPEVLASVGVNSAAVCRIDGMYFLGNETELPGKFPRPGSSADRLFNDERTLDFVWRGPDGALMLCHWLAFTYGQGEMLSHVGFTRQAGAPLAIRWPTERHVARMVDKYVRQLAPVALTPYLLCPIGFDFSAPIHGLVGLLDRYNERVFPRSGTWVVNAGLDDYLELVGHRRDRLPVLDLDPSQYFTGFFTSRPTLKRRYRCLVDTLLLAERLSLAPDAPEGSVELVRRGLSESWWTAATANHHDYITGTAPDRVVRKEQLPWLDDALRAAQRVLSAVAGEPGSDSSTDDRVETAEPDDSGRRPPPAASPGSRDGNPSWRRHGTKLEIETAALRLEIDEELGGSLVSATMPDGTELLGGGTSLEAIAYEDSGGLWRAAYEYAGGRFAEVDRIGSRRVSLQASVLNDGTVEVASAGTLDGCPFRRWIWVDPVHPMIRVRTESTLADRRTATITVALPSPVDQLVTDVPGGVVTRPVRGWFDPTFWPAQSFVHYRPERAGDHHNGIALLLGLPGAVATRPAGAGATVEVVLARNAVKEMAYKVLPLPAQPARGHDPGPHRFDMTVVFTGDGDWRSSGLPALALLAGRRARMSTPALRLAARADHVITVEPSDVALLAAKPSQRGPGIVVRLSSTATGRRTATLRWAGVELASAALCDGRERDIEAITASGDRVMVEVPPGITSIRLVSRS